MQFLQKIVGDWVIRSFGRQSFDDCRERSKRVLEEAIELAQSMGVSIEDANKIVEVVYSRPMGQAKQEAAGVGVCLLAFAQSYGFDLQRNIEAEIERVLHISIDHFKMRHQEKHELGIASKPE